MNLESERLKLIEITWDDLDRIHHLNSFPEVDRFNTLGIPADIEDTREVLRILIEDQKNTPRTKYAWAIWFKNEFAGEFGMNVGRAKTRRAELYFALAPSYWGIGIATEAAKAIVRFGFDNLALHRIEAGVATKNAASIRVIEKIGMTREGLGRQILPIRGEWVDNFSYSILENDPRNY